MGGKSVPVMQFLGEGKVWMTPSSSRLGLFHITVLSDLDVPSCTCEGWRSHKKCWHVTAILPEPTEDFQVSL